MRAWEQTYLLRTIRAEQEHGLVPVGKRDTVNPRPDVSKAAGGELHTGREAELGVARELRVRLPVVEQVLVGDGALHCGKEILGSHAVSYRRMC